MGEITFDHNNEALDTTIAPDQISYRRREIKIKNWFIFFAIVLLGGRVIVTSVPWVRENVGANSLTFWEIESILYLIFLTYNFVSLYYLMNKNHNFQF